MPRMIDDDGTEMLPCECCNGGHWETECCNGSGGCSCGGQRIDMGPCHVCRGLAYRRPDANLNANINTIQGLCYIGSGPVRYGRPPRRSILGVTRHLRGMPRRWRQKRVKPMPRGTHAA